MPELRPIRRSCARAIVIVLSLIGPVLALGPANDAAAQGASDVVINEFVASNQSGLVDNTGSTEDWIELHNTTGATIDLGDWSLTNGADTFTFASGTSIAGNGYVVLFASGDESRTEPGEVHLPFKLAASGESLELRDDGGSLSAPAWPAPGYPSQIADVSFGLGSDGNLYFFDSPTPGAANPGGGLAGVVSAVTFSVDHGFYDTTQTVVLDTSTPSTTIRYTTDGTTPTATVGTALAPGQSITIDSTSTIRAVATRSGWVTSAVETRTYLFTADIVEQGATPPPGFPADNAINGQDMDYGMDADVVDPNPALVQNALEAIPTISVVTDLDNLFDADDGIYVNAGNRGRDWERPASIELIDPSGAEDGFEINGGIRMRGGFSRSSANPKHSFRLFFRDEYESELDYALFGDDGLDTYTKVDLRTSQNYAWSWRRSTEATFMDELWSRDTQAAMGQPHTRSRQYHLYVNGQYWGIYMTQERVSADYGEAYLGGDDDDYDVVKRGAPAVTVEASDGDLTAFQSLYPLVEDGTVDAGEYAQIAAQVDLVNLADYYLLHFFTGDFDGSPSWFFSFDGDRWTASNNWYAIRNRTGAGDGGKWQFFDHDSEHSLCASAGPGLRENIDNTTPWPLRTGQEYMSPGWLHQALISNENYVQIFRDRVQLHMVDSAGALTVAAANARLDARAAELTVAIDAESARWGDGPNSTDSVYGRTQWNNGLQRLRDCFTDRQSIVETQLTADGLWPEGVPPSISPSGAAVVFNTQVSFDAVGQPGTIWVTTDGTDPRGDDGSPSATAVAGGASVAVTGDMVVSARILDGGEWSPLASESFTLSSPAGPVTMALNEYNAVSAGNYLGGGGAGDIANGSDATLGRVLGNGGDWFELIVIDEGLDIGGWTIEVWNDQGGTLTRNAALVLVDDPVLSDLHAGTLITISESIGDDVSYRPQIGDWHLNLQSNDAGDGAFVTPASQSDFVIDNDDTQIAIFDAAGLPVALRTGEGTGNGAGVGSDEVFKYEGTPSPSITPGDGGYDDGTSSSWGLPNEWDDGAATQDLAPIRLPFGSVDCDGVVTVLDALQVAQFDVALRFDAGSCPVADPETQVFAAPGDVNDDGATNVLDALLIAQCVVGLNNQFCPA